MYTAVQIPSCPDDEAQATFQFRFDQWRDRHPQSTSFRDIAKLRYQVYCEEFQYLEPSHYGEGLETDQYDNRAIHVSAEDKKGQTVGTVRLVLTDDQSKFPFEEHCALYPDVVLPDRRLCGEVSRLIVRENFRRPRFETLRTQGSGLEANEPMSGILPPAFGAPKLRSSNASLPIMLGMYRELYRYSIRHGIHYWYAAMERRLARLTSRMGFQFVPIGPETDYYGPVGVFMATLSDIEHALDMANLLSTRDVRLTLHDIPGRQRGLGVPDVNSTSRPLELVRSNDR